MDQNTYQGAAMQTTSMTLSLCAFGVLMGTLLVKHRTHRSFSRSLNG